jgi:hypothetical protein
MSQIQNNLLQQLDVKKNGYRWIPHKLTSDKKEQLIEWCRKKATLQIWCGIPSTL